LYTVIIFLFLKCSLQFVPQLLALKVKLHHSLSPASLLYIVFRRFPYIGFWRLIVQRSDRTDTRILTNFIGVLLVSIQSILKKLLFFYTFRGFAGISPLCFDRPKVCKISRSWCVLRVLGKICKINLMNFDQF
jgi:hypothetical protein